MHKSPRYLGIFFLFFTFKFIMVLGIWPLPSNITMDVNSIVTLGIVPNDFTIQTNFDCFSILKNAINRYKSNLLFPFKNTNPQQQHSSLNQLSIQITGNYCEPFAYSVDESYTLNILLDNQSIPVATLQSDTIYGAIRGLETFAQLIVYKEYLNTYEIPNIPVFIYDKPRFSWRGLLIDTGRHWLPVSTIKKIIDGMELNKFNILHWHFTDAQSFPLQLKNLPLLSKGAYSSVYTYKVEDITDIVNYATARAIRIIPEFDMPSHVASWGAAYNITIPCRGYSIDMALFDPSLPELYDLLDTFFAEVIPLFPDKYIHLGGDEVKTTCWLTNPAIMTWARNNRLASGSDIWRYFTDKLQNITKKYDKQFVFWLEIFSNGVLPANTTAFIQPWMDPDNVRSAVSAGKNVINSGDWYLDRQVPTRRGARYLWVETWIDFWLNEPTRYILNETQKSLVRGGEACMWGEQVDSTNIENMIWPRAAGASERLWSPISNFGDPLLQYATKRLVSFRCRMAQLGINAGPIQPDYCLLPWLLNNNLTISSTQPLITTNVPSTNAPTISTTVPSTNAPTISTTAPSTNVPTLPATVPSTNSPTISTTVPSTNAPTLPATTIATDPPTSSPSCSGFKCYSTLLITTIVSICTLLLGIAIGSMIPKRQNSELISVPSSAEDL